MNTVYVLQLAKTEYTGEWWLEYKSNSLWRRTQAGLCKMAWTSSNPTSVIPSGASELYIQLKIWLPLWDCDTVLLLTTPGAKPGTISKQRLLGWDTGEGKPNVWSVEPSGPFSQGRVNTVGVVLVNPGYNRLISHPHVTGVNQFVSHVYYLLEPVISLWYIVSVCSACPLVLHCLDRGS